MTTKGLNYDVKILLAWGESISGNKKIIEWLMKNGYSELGLFHFALRNEDRSRQWLLDNKFPHLMALINGIEGNKKALEWLKVHGFETLFKMALIGDGHEDVYEDLQQSELKLFAILAKKMQIVKDEIEEQNNDIHRISNS
jgi:hypothetical protein